MNLYLRMEKHNANRIFIYNSLSGNKEEFRPITNGYVGMYVCGPTVYSNVHLGNVRTFMSFDVIYRYFLHLGYKVRYVRNITDAGHLLDNEEDRISKQSRLEQIEPMEVVQKYTVDFHTILSKFNFLPPNVEPTATGHIVEQWEIIQKLINSGLAYISNESVYFDVKKYNEKETYGELSKRNIDELLVNTRILDGQDEKRNPQDFALWKKASPEHIMKWKSPWGIGFPGWHLECTAMSTKYLGEQFDIHGGGLDLKFPHHECEIAQAKASNGKKPVNYWMHTNMLTLNGQKMSKSTGNFILPMELISGKNKFFEKAIHPSVIRFFFMQTHYRSTLDLTNEAVLASERGFYRLLEAMKVLEKLSSEEQTTFSYKEWKQGCYNAMNDDFNTPILISYLFEGVKHIYSIQSKNETISEEDLQDFKDTFYRFFYDVLGLEDTSQTENSSKLSDAMQVLIELRNEARSGKNFILSDQIRNKLQEKGIQLKDGKEGTSFEIS